jgi:hypothetical protein
MANYPGRQLVYLRTLLPRDVWEKDTLMAKALKGLQKELGAIRAEVGNRKGGNVIVLNILILFDSNYRYAKIELPIMIAFGGWS